MIPRKNLLVTLLLTLCSTCIPSCATDVSDAIAVGQDSEQTVKENIAQDDNSLIPSLTFSQMLKWGGLSIILVGGGVYFYQREQAKKPLSAIEEYRLFVDSKNRANDAKHGTWGGTLLTDQAIKTALDGFMAKNATDRDISKKDDALIGLLASYLQKEGIDITYVTDDGPACIGLIPMIAAHATAITPNAAAYVFSQLYYLSRYLVGKKRAKAIFSAKEGRLLAKLVIKHNANDLRVNEKYIGAAPVKINTMPSMQVVMTLGGVDPSTELQFDDPLFQNKTSIANAAAAKADGAKVRIEKRGDQWRVTGIPVLSPT